MNRFVRWFLLGLCLTTLVVGQSRPPGSSARGQAGPAFDTLMLDTGPGSFRAEGEGQIVIDTLGGVGTVFVSNLRGPNKMLWVEGLRKEYDDGVRLAFHGTGRVEVRGKFRAVNWMGNRMKGSFRGKGMIRLYGDLDKNLRTGLVWYPGFVDDKGKQVVENWETFGREFHVPKPKNYQPRPRDFAPQLHTR